MIQTILDIVVKLIGANLAKVICSVCDAVKSFFSYKKAAIDEKVNTTKEQKEAEYNEKVDKVTKDGTIDDLLDLKR